MKRLIAFALAATVAAVPAIAHEGQKDAHHAGLTRKEQKPWGVAGDAKAATRTVEIVMSDTMRFTPDRIDVRQGEIVKFVVKNSGGMLHELVLGTRQELDEHAALMLKFPNMEHDEAHMVHVPQGKAGTLVWNFNRAGEFQFACLIPGHYQAGMWGTVYVAPSVAANSTPSRKTR